MAKWYTTKFRGVRYRKHATRKHGALQDKYFTIRVQFDGKRQEEGLGWSSQGWSEKNAALELEKLKENHKKGKGPVRLKEKRELADQEREKSEREKITFGQLWADYLIWAKNNKAHWHNDEFRYEKHLKTYIADMHLTDITPQFLDKLKNKITRKGLAPATVKYVLIVVRQVFNKAKIWGKWKGENPISGIKLPKVDNITQRALTVKEEKALFQHLKIKSCVTWGISVVSLYAGLRYMEVASLRWQQINFRDKKITVHGKGGKTRTVPMNNTILKVLKEIKAKAPTTEFIDLIFPNHKGQVRNKISVTYYRTVKDLDFNKNITDRRYKIDFHSLRHTFTTRLASAGTPLHVLRDLLGHADLSMVSRYVHLIPSQADVVVGALDKYQK